MLRDFICELTPDPSDDSIEDNIFYFKFRSGKDYSVYGVSDSGTLKKGKSTFSDESGRMKGTYVQDGVEISFELALNLIDVGVTLGGGIWKEWDDDGDLIQQYSVKAFDKVFSKIDKRYFASIFDKAEKVDGKYSRLIGVHSQLKAEIAKSDERLQALEATWEEFADTKGELDEALISCNTLYSELESRSKSFAEKEDEFSKLREKIDKANDDANQLLNKFDGIAAHAEEVKRKADLAFSSAITVRLANSFRARKAEAGKLREIYDRVFVFSLIVALIISIVAFWSGKDDTSGLLGYFEYFLLRIPLLAFPVWIAVSASKKTSAATRLEEFYAQKQALAESYEGYKSEISLLNKDSNRNDLEKLMAINLISISKDSSEILDSVSNEKHTLLSNLLGEDFLKGFMSGKPPRVKEAKDNKAINEIVEPEQQEA